MEKHELKGKIMFVHHKSSTSDYTRLPRLYNASIGSYEILPWWSGFDLAKENGRNN